MRGDIPPLHNMPHGVVLN